ncbi:MAG: thiol-disulfide oxidoreductase DCC family protein [Cyclobacteriaceae bacterium]|jgi:predicted DCC family thiol-disulfide oxidoreductase YuxK|nr:thiol-disulfide oxidoreductase DCC family protein [Cyclobacteriaceae bacterium]
MSDQTVVLFDGVCNLCSAAVLFIIKRDPTKQFRFASLQSRYGQLQLKRFNLSATELNSVLLVHDGKLFQKSTAALKIASKLNNGWPLLYLFIIVPGFIRNWIYDWIARNRYAWFGKKDECMIPTPEINSRFID